MINVFHKTLLQNEVDFAYSTNILITSGVLLKEFLKQVGLSIYKERNTYKENWKEMALGNITSNSYKTVFKEHK